MIGLEALQDLRDRVAKYESQYETINNDSMSYVKIFNLSTKLMVNHIYGRMAKDVVPALMAWHIGTRPIYLCRPGQTLSGIVTDAEDYVNRTRINMDDFDFKNISEQRSGLRGDTLGPNGQRFSQELLEFCTKGTHDFVKKRASVRDRCSFAGTSGAGEFMKEPLRIYTSTMPRAYETVAWDGYEVTQKSNLNPLDKGDYAGIDLVNIKSSNPEWYGRLERDPFKTRYVKTFSAWRSFLSRACDSDFLEAKAIAI
jgi:6-phosphofructo-2-kinase/Histidine phosphatase superfamily (branch 1)